MRVQHNITSMNAYRNYNGNTKNIGKNLEKLSSGYKINRAGDDAAGLAISEKMRAQITGLEGAQKNAKDGISLVQTAEGALTEVHSMLNRMYSLAEQSANGTYDSSVDRAQLQKEVESLRTEINRIADSANFNGIKLLDGSLSGNSQVSNLAVTESIAIAGQWKSQALTASNADYTSILKQEDIGKTMDLTVTWKDGNDNLKTSTISLTFQGNGDNSIDTNTKTNNYFTDANGTEYKLGNDGKLAIGTADTGMAGAILAGLQRDEELSAAFTMDYAAGTKQFQFDAKVAGTKGAKVVGIGISTTFTNNNADVVWDAAKSVAGNTDLTAANAPLDAMQKIDPTSMNVAVAGNTIDEVTPNIFEVDGHKFLLANSMDNDVIKALGDDVTIIDIGAGAANAPAHSQKIAAEITRVTGLATDVKAANNDANIEATDILFTKDHLRLSGSALTLQIGDTAANYNKMDVQIGDIHVNKLGNDDLKLDNIDIGKQDGAQKAMDALKAAINTVSDIRGTLGATQNRLEHTINNLSVMQENIQDAESTIRDTDVADEMMKYTKNSILVQSAQAMLAQANQQPQGVLQLLQ